MKKGIFISCERNTPNNYASGVLKKVIAQIDVLNISGKLSCEHCTLPNTKMRYIINLYKNVLDNTKGIDFFYIRRINPVNHAVLSFFKKIKNNNPSCKILYELPTYPYDKEDRMISVLIDRLNRINLKKYVDRIVTLTHDDTIFGIPTIKIVNGILCKDIPTQKPAKTSRDLHLIAVANFSSYHGYDRLIAGLNDYYKNSETKINVYLHFVGDGLLLKKYKIQIMNYKLDEFCFFHGSLSGNELTQIYNLCDIAVCGLGSHRIGIYLTSQLKSREYLARGLPIVTSTKIDIIPSDFMYCLKITEDESPVDISMIVNFYHELLAKKGKIQMIGEIRQFAEENCEMSKTMKPIVDYLLEENI
jgi:hypothetical protein